MVIMNLFSRDYGQLVIGKKNNLMKELDGKWFGQQIHLTKHNLNQLKTNDFCQL
jgi:hypothetical protein